MVRKLVLAGIASLVVALSTAPEAEAGLFFRRCRPRSCCCRPVCCSPTESKPRTPEAVANKVQELVKILAEPLAPIPEMPADVAELLGLAGK